MKIAKQQWLGVLIVAAIILYTFSAASTQQIVSSRAYSGHTNDADANHFVNAYPQTVGTRLDDCQVCHRSGVARTDTEKEYNNCGYCHLMEFPNPKYATGVPKTFEDTLNPYGLAYKKAGRNAAAIAAIANEDSDGDGVANALEIAESKYPGDAASKPGQPLIPLATLTYDAIKAMPVHEQFLLMNATKQQFDEYAVYTGVTVKELLAAAKVDLTGATGITVFAPDGFSTDYSLDDVMTQFPNGYFYAEPQSLTDKEMQFVTYPEPLPAGLTDKAEIANPLWLQVAYMRNGKELEKSYYEKKTGRLQGEGPYRLVIPQRDPNVDPAKPGRPDRGSKAKTFNDGWDFNEKIDHNAGQSVRGMCVIRVNPMPQGFEEFDWKNGWSLIDEKKIIIYGHGVPAP